MCLSIRTETNKVDLLDWKFLLFNQRILTFLNVVLVRFKPSEKQKVIEEHFNNLKQIF